MSVTRAPAELPPFSGLDGTCRKCGAVAGVVWHCISVAEDFPCKHVRLMDEHMCRVCPCCGYGWMEAPADAAGRTDQ